MYGGLSKSMPYFAIFFFLISLSAIALPLTAGFVSEFLVLLGSYISGKFWVYFAILGVVLTAVYMLNAFQKMFLFKETDKFKNLKDLNLNEFLYLSPLVLLLFFMGVFPQFFFNYSKSSLEHLNNNLSNYSLSFYKKQADQSKTFLKSNGRAGQPLNKKNKEQKINFKQNERAL